MNPLNETRIPSHIFIVVIYDFIVNDYLCYIMIFNVVLKTIYHCNSFVVNYTKHFLEKWV